MSKCTVSDTTAFLVLFPWVFALKSRFIKIMISKLAFIYCFFNSAWCVFIKRIHMGNLIGFLGCHAFLNIIYIPVICNIWFNCVVLWADKAFLFCFT